MNKLILSFNELSSEDVNFAGGKGASLGEMTQAGIPVPFGFVISSFTFDQFIKDADLVQEIDAILDKVNHKETHTIESASEKIQGLIKNAIIPESIASEIKRQFKQLDAEYVAVRSSATAEDGVDNAWAGQLDSFLNIKEETLLEKVQCCWASLFTPRAIFYRFEKGLHVTKISVAVVIQKMVNSEISGIAFSVHPVTEDRNQLIIEAGFGLGEAIVSGQITPDSYVIEKEPRKIIDINIVKQERGLYRMKNGGNEWQPILEPKASSQVLNETQILELSTIILGIEKHYGFPCDIEWAFEQKKFYILQSRPITTLKEQNHNKHALNIAKKWEKVSTRRTTIHRYFDFSEAADKGLQKLIGASIPESILISKNGEVTEYQPKNQVDSLLKILMHQFESPTFIQKISSELFKVSTDIIEWIKINCSVEKIRNISDVELAQILIGRHIKHIDLVTWQWLGFSGKYCIDSVLGQRIEFYHLPKEETLKIIFSHDHFIHIAEEDFNLKQIALKIQKEVAKKEIEKLISEHLEKYDFINMYDETYLPANKEQTVLRLKGYVGNKDLENELKTSSDSLHKNSSQYSLLLSSNKFSKNDLALIKFAHGYASFMELRNFYRAQAAFYSAPFFNEVAKRLGLSIENLLAFSDYEIADALKGNKQIINKDAISRRNYCVCFYSPVEWSILNSKESKIIDDAITKIEMTSEIKGVVAFKGSVVRGRVKIINSVADMGKLKEGDILVSSMTRPEFIMSIQKAAAIITDEGGMLCHAAIVSRELKKPCIIGTKIATKFLKDNDLVEVDTNTGSVIILK